MVQFANPGDFCPNKECLDYGKLQESQSRQNIIKAGKTKAGIQRYECKTCQRTFTETTGTLFYRKRTAAATILEILALIAEGNRLSSLTRVKGVKEDTMLVWLRAAAKHVEAVNEVLLKDFQIQRGQLDGLWLFIQNKGQKKSRGKQCA